MTEAQLQKRIRLDLERRGWLVVKISLCSKPGFPDLIAMGNKERIMFIEIKRKGKKAEPLQLHRHEELFSRGFDIFVIDTWEGYLDIWK